MAPKMTEELFLYPKHRIKQIVNIIFIYFYSCKLKVGRWSQEIIRGKFVQKMLFMIVYYSGWYLEP